MPLSKKQLRIIQKVLTIGILIFTFEFLFPYQTADAQFGTSQPGQGPILTLPEQYPQPDIEWQLVEDNPPKQILYVIATGYSSTPDQTDETPFITANGKRVYDGLVANNSLKFGTQVKFPEEFGGKEFAVDDRMHSRFGTYRVDIWFPTRKQALEFGVKYLTMEIY